MTVVMKNVAREEWRLFKMEAAKHDMKIAEFFSKILREHLHREEEGKKEWEVIFKRKAFLTAEEADKMKESSSELRKNFRMRY